MAEGGRFEPPKRVSSFNNLANRRLQPLGHRIADFRNEKAGQVVIGCFKNSASRWYRMLGFTAIIDDERWRKINAQYDYFYKLVVMFWGGECR